MKMTKIAIYAIARDEEQNVPRFLKACEEADEIVVVVDYRSNDKTYDLLVEAAGNEANGKKRKFTVVRDQTIYPFRFDKMRNYALSLVSENVDYCISLDFDENIDSGYHEALNRHSGYNLIQANYFETTSGNIYPVHRIHTRHDFKWVNPVHEELKFEYGKPAIGLTDDIFIVHSPELRKTRDYHELVKLALEEDPKNKRFMIYDAIYSRSAEKFEKVVTADWNYDEEDRFWHAYAALELARMNESFPASAISIAPDWADVWCEGAEWLFNKKKFSEAWFAIQQALKQKPCGRSFQNPKYVKPFDLAIKIGYAAGKAREAAALRLSHLKGLA